MLREDLNGRLLQRAELVGQREELDETIELFKEQNTLETDYYDLEKNVKSSLENSAISMNKLSHEKKNYLYQLKEISIHLTNLNDQLFTIAKKHQISLNERNDRLGEYNYEIDTIESKIDKMVLNLKLPCLEDLLSDLFSDEENKIERAILSNQISLIQEEKRKIDVLEIENKDNVLSSIENVNVERKELKNKTDKSSNSIKMKQFEVGRDLLNSALKKWEEKVSSHNTSKLLISASTTADEYELLTNSIMNLLIETDTEEEVQKQFMYMIAEYFSNLEKKEVYSKLNNDDLVIL